MEEQQRLDAITEAIIGAAIEVHRVLGPGLLESASETCLLSGCQVGLLINFHSYSLRDGIRRVVNGYPDSSEPLRSLRASAFSALKG